MLDVDQDYCRPYKIRNSIIVLWQ